MKRMLAVVFAALLVISLVFTAYAKEKKVDTPVLTTEQTYTQKLQVLAQQRKQYLTAIQQIEIKMIATQAVLDYIKVVAAEESNKEDK